MSQIRLIALDLDDTLLRNDRTISNWTKSVLKKAEDAGITVLLASGRAPAAMERYVQELDMHKQPGYVLASNGVTILRSDTGAVLKEVQLPIAPALEVFDFVHAEGLPVQVYKENNIFVSQYNEFAAQSEKSTGLKQVVVENFRALIEAGQIKMVIPGEWSVIDPLATILSAFFSEQVTIVTSRPFFLEILPPASGKGEALAWVCDELGIKQSEVLAFGDSMNDESMIRWAGTGVAMLNGDQRIKDVASLVTRFTNDEDGVADIVDQYVLANKPFPRESGPQR